MILIIGMMDNKMRKFLTSHRFEDKVKVINKMCNVKFIKEDVKVIIPFGFVTENGLVSNTLVDLYELLISLNVLEVIYHNSYNEKIIYKICNELNVSVKKG